MHMTACIQAIVKLKIMKMVLPAVLKNLSFFSCPLAFGQNEHNLSSSCLQLVASQLPNYSTLRLWQACARECVLSV